MHSRDERDGVIAIVDHPRHVVDLRSFVVDGVVETADVEAELGEFRRRKNEVGSESVDDDEDDLTDGVVGKTPAANFDLNLVAA